MLHGLGYRFTVNGPKNRSLPGRPDIFLPRLRTVVFIHGCFWHGHVYCEHFRLPKSRTEWWRKKIEADRSRDLKNERLLNLSGWDMVTVWEGTLKTVAGREWLLSRLP